MNPDQLKPGDHVELRAGVNPDHKGYSVTNQHGLYRVVDICLPGEKGSHPAYPEGWITLSVIEFTKEHPLFLHRLTYYEWSLDYPYMVDIRDFKPLLSILQERFIASNPNGRWGSEEV
jgi:hypothetical protein